jgi:hypothetical protein
VSWQGLRDAWQAAIVAASGLSDDHVIWAYQNANQPKWRGPTDEYISMTMQPMQTKGIDWLRKDLVPNWQPSTAYVVGQTVVNDYQAGFPRRYTCSVAGTSASSGGPTGTGATAHDGTVTWLYKGMNQELQSTVRGVREVVFQLQFFSETTSDPNDASILGENTKTALLLNSVRDILTVVGISPFDPGDVQYVPEVTGTTFRGRAMCDIRCYAPAQDVAEWYGYITSVNGTATYVDPVTGSPVVIPFNARGG